MSLHTDFKRSPFGGWLAWCPFRKVWAAASSPEGGYRCAGCGTDLNDRINEKNEVAA